MNRSFNPAEMSSGLITLMLYQMLNALPTMCGISGANAVTRSGCRLTAASMAENSREESLVPAISLLVGRAEASGSSSFFQKRIRVGAPRGRREAAGEG